MFQYCRTHSEEVAEQEYIILEKRDTVSYLFWEFYTEKKSWILNELMNHVETKVNAAFFTQHLNEAKESSANL